MKHVLFYVLIVTVLVPKHENVEMDEAPKGKLLDALCRSFRKEENLKKLSSDSAENCDKFNITSLHLLGMNQTSSDSLRFCMDGDTAKFFWNSSNINNSAYFVETVRDDDSKTFSDVIGESPYFILINLKENTVYNVRLWTVTYSARKITYSNLTEIKTPRKNAIPSPVRHFFPPNFTLQENSYDAIIKWSPNEENSCIYEAVWIQADGVEQRIIDVILDSHQVKLTELKFGANYTINIKANSETSGTESPFTNVNISTPSCIESYQRYPLERCRPAKPRNFEVRGNVANSSGQNEYEIHVSWLKPDLQPSYYLIRLITISKYMTKDAASLNVTGEATTATFKNVKRGCSYQAILTACSPGGCSPRVMDVGCESELRPHE